MVSTKRRQRQGHGQVGKISSVRNSRLVCLEFRAQNRVIGKEAPSIAGSPRPVVVLKAWDLVNF